MHRIALLLPLLVLGCAAPQMTGFRAQDRDIYSTAVVDTARLTGRWSQVADFAPKGAAACSASGIHVDAGLSLQADLCLAGRRTGFSGQAEVAGPGRLRLAGADPGGIGAEWWVLWVDGDYRTLVVGTPDGRFGFILNRDPVLPADRMTAAREVLAWNGYDLSRMRAVSVP
jgi:apolipoprotein D and lipocalin family protein